MKFKRYREECIGLGLGYYPAKPSLKAALYITVGRWTLEVTFGR